MEIIVFTDGACSYKKDEYYAGYGIYYPNKELPNVSKPFTIKPITHQRAELYAIYTALKEITDKLDFSKIYIYTDSKYSVNALTEWIYIWVKNDWKKEKNKIVKNRDILEKIYQILITNKDKIQFIHIPAHTKKRDFLSIGNKIADALAVRGSKKGQKSIISIDTSYDNPSDSSSEGSSDIDIIVK